MIIVEILANSGQGNQMFQYLFAYAKAKKMNKKLIIITTDVTDERPYCLNKFSLDKNVLIRTIKIPRFKHKKVQIIYGKIVRKLVKIRYNHDYIIEKDNCHRKYTNYDLEKNKNYYISGYFESYKYFDNYKKDVIKQFEPIYEIDENTKKTFEEIKNCNSISLHIRRGDFEGVGRTINIDYFKEQMEKMRKKVENPIFYLATQDEKVIEEFKNCDDVRVINCKGENKDLNDWLCLKYCHHHIITNSTYSWWAAYLSDYKDKIVSIMSKEQYNAIENPTNPNEYEDFYPVEWLDENK